MAAQSGGFGRSCKNREYPGAAKWPTLDLYVILKTTRQAAMERSLTHCDPSGDAILGEVAEEFFDRLARGENPDIEKYVQQHPEFAEYVRDIFPALELIKHSPDSTPQGVVPNIDPEELNRLGDYQILGELGRGGMGVVYEALQISLNRRVALKVLPFAAVMDSKQLERFKTEAQAAARLDHPNIVNVYAVGCERAVHFYAMRYVHGQTIQELISVLRQQSDVERCEDQVGSRAISQLAKEFSQGRMEVSDGDKSQDPNRTVNFGRRLTPADSPSAETKPKLQTAISTQHSASNKDGFYRSVASLGVQAAAALDHAHEFGVLHRDIKPGNLMLDAEGKLWVTDFGLARIEADVGMTMTGDVLGTLRYMSPEQALAKRGIVDHRADIYSLGVTLYELLILQPTYAADDRQELLNQIAFNEPRRLRLLDHQIPVELESIVGKAIEKDPADRYGTALELADDLQRYLDQRPILARLPSLTTRLVKWSKRHVGMVWTLVLAALTLAVALGVSTVQISASRNQTEHARRLAEDKSILLEEQRDRARENESFARQLVYASDVRLAAQAWQDGDVRHYADLLDRHAQSASSEDLRGFAWRYLRQLGTANFHTIAEGSQGICSVRYSPDGKFLAVGQYDGKIQVRDGRNDQQLAMLSGHMDLVTGIGFSPDSKRLSSIGYDGVIRIWDLETFREIRSIKAFEDAHGYRVCFAFDGQAVIAIAEDSPAKIWDIDSGELMDTFGANGIGCWGLAVSPDGHTCVVRDNRTDFRIWEVNPRKHVAWMRFPLPNESAYCVRYSPDGELIAAGTDENRIRIYEARTGKLIATFEGHDDEIWDVAFHPNGTILASCDSGGVIRTWHLGDLAQSSDANEFGNWLSSFRGHAARAWSVDFSPDGKRLVSASKDGTVRAWASRTQLRQELDVAESVASDFLPSGDELFIAMSHSIARWNRRTNTVQPFCDSFQYQATSLAVLPNGEIIATGHADGIVRLWNRKTEQIAKLLRGHEDGVDQIAFSPNGTLMVTASWDGTAKLWDVGTGEQRHVIEVPPHCCSAAFSPDGQTFAISSGNDAMLYDVASGRRLHLLNGHQSTAKCVSFSPDGRWLATGSRDRTIRIWDVRTGKIRHTIAAHREQIYALSFSPDGRTIATGDDHGTVAFSHVETGRFLFDTKVADGKISHLSFSPDGKTLAATHYANHVVLLRVPGPSTFN
jgi:eukaryotic-like serine/threonine-protein kinase